MTPQAAPPTSAVPDSDYIFMSPEELCTAYETGSQTQRRVVMMIAAVQVQCMLQMAGWPKQVQAHLLGCLTDRMSDGQRAEFLGLGYQMAVGCSVGGDCMTAARILHDVLKPYL